MENASLYIEKKIINNINLESILFIVNSFEDFKIIKDIDIFCNLKSIYIYSKKMLTVEKFNNNIVWCNKIPRDFSFDIVVFLSCTNTNDLKSLIFMQKAKQILIFNSNNIGFSFDIWEYCREIVSSIEIISENEYKCQRILKWFGSKNDIELSVILPTYNVEKYLHKCIESLIKNKKKYIEFLFIDDGSNDNSSKIIKKYAKKDPRVKYFKKENGGCASARNYGIKLSKGKYLSFIDPDDFINPKMFEKLLMSVMSGSYDVGFCGYNEFYDDTKKICVKKEGCINNFYENGTYDRKKVLNLISNMDIAIWRGIYSKHLLIKNNIYFFEELKRFDDLPFKCLVYLYARSVICYPKQMYYYRLNRPGQDVACNDDKLFVHFKIFDLLDKYFLGKNELIIKYYSQVKNNTHNWALSKLVGKTKKEYKKKLQTKNI